MRKCETSQLKICMGKFFWMIRGSGAGYVPLINRSGSGSPKNIWIRIRNTDLQAFFCEARVAGLESCSMVLGRDYNGPPYKKIFFQIFFGLMLFMQ
jgi:hypothetical protein